MIHTGMTLIRHFFNAKKWHISRNGEMKVIIRAKSGLLLATSERWPPLLWELNDTLNVQRQRANGQKSNVLVFFSLNHAESPEIIAAASLSTASPVNS